jgi:hypothetical protein
MRLYLICGIIFAVFVPCAIAAQKPGGETVQRLQNRRVGVVFDLARGTYDLLDAASGQAVVKGARAEVAQWASDDPAYDRTARTSEVRDELGSGHSLTVECAAAGKPSLLLEFRIYGEERGYVVLRSGWKNTGAEAFRVKDFRPLAGGAVFPGGGWSDVRTLTSNSGCNQAAVSLSPFARSGNNLLLTLRQDGRRRSLVLGGLKTADFTKWARTRPSGDVSRHAAASAALEASDPIGKLLEAGEIYLPDDSFYIDFLTPNPFAALEGYGRRLRAATGAKPSPYDFPTVCAWYAGCYHSHPNGPVPGAQENPARTLYRINTTPGIVEEMRKAREAGLFRYVRMAGRLVPDMYHTNNPQGWWDDAHWQRDGYYAAPYETSAKYGAGVHREGGLAFTYIQPTCVGLKSLISRDFRAQHPDWLCGKSLDRTLDYTHPAVQEYMQKVFGALRGNIDGLMVDYCDDLWQSEASQGGFHDRHATGAAFYRTFFRLVKDGLGPNSWLHERNVGQPNNDLTLGIVDSQRTSWDSTQIAPELVSRSGLRWYKNRVVIAYDMDGKSLTDAWIGRGWTGSDRDGRRMTLTMAYVAAGRLLLTRSFRDMPPATLHDLSRTFPYPSEPRSARPVDAFTHPGWPRVYDYAVNDHWHQLTLYNNTLPTRAETISVPLAGDSADGALGLRADREYYAYDFWNDRYAGRIPGAGRLVETLRPGEARMIALHEVEPRPQFLATDRHLMQGLLDLPSKPVWDERSGTLSGSARVVADEAFRIVIAGNGRTPKSATCAAGEARVEPVDAAHGLHVLVLEAKQAGDLAWSLSFQ